MYLGDKCVCAVSNRRPLSLKEQSAGGNSRERNPRVALAGVHANILERSRGEKFDDGREVDRRGAANGGGGAASLDAKGVKYGTKGQAGLAKQLDNEGVEGRALGETPGLECSLGSDAALPSGQSNLCWEASTKKGEQVCDLICAYP